MQWAAVIYSEFRGVKLGRFCFRRIPGASERLNPWFEVASTQLQDALVEEYEDMCDDDEGLENRTFLCTHEDALACWADRQDVKTLQRVTDGKYASEPRCVARVLTSCRLGKAILSSSWRGVSRELLLSDVRRELAQLERFNYDEDAVCLYEREIDQLKAGLATNGHMLCRKELDCEVSIYVEIVIIPLNSCGDEERLLRAAREGTLICNARQLQALRWEDLQFPRGYLDECPDVARHPRRNFQFRAAFA